MFGIQILVVSFLNTGPDHHVNECISIEQCEEAFQFTNDQIS